MEPGNLGTTVRRKELLTTQNDKEEYQLQSFNDKKEDLAKQQEEGNAPLSKKDRGNFALLVVLYLLQGVPVGLSFGSIPFLLKAHLSYSQIAIFSLSSWPYSLKLIWSPIVDAVYSKELGRRKSWIVPIQLLTGCFFYWLGSHIDDIMDQEEHIPIYRLTISFLLTVFFCATQDIAVDGWALTLLSKESLSYASTAQTIGLNIGYFMSFTVFLALNSPDFSNKYLRSEPNDIVGVLPLGAYMKFWALMFFLVTGWLLFMKKEAKDMGIRQVYTTIWKICKLPHMKNFVIVLMTSKIGFICHEAVTSLKLVEKGFSKEDMALSVLLDFPLQIFFGYYAAKWSNGSRPLKPWLYAFYGRLLFSALGMLVVAGYPQGKSDIGYFYFSIIIASTVLSSFMSTVQFVSLAAFMTNIADPVIGGTYMTLLNTFSNFGGTWPKFFVLEAVDYFTVSRCSITNAKDQGKLIIVKFSCTSDAGRTLCKDLDGTCLIETDGYYYAGSLCVLIGLVMLVFYIKPVVKHLEKLSKSMWRLNQ
ncbi:acetyl-coenzyme A transporter 1-domain-containing protein [Halteromyces radiatus]|uniref:acetyl-coenzyme A transporter 1-domain-containing protein n=1 Tax=Halteromyces radiatus TaxID=101107 RepID=UPI00221FFFCD|nr:acetyl-coenzyme A transporter 1-domain-containing protein [Halteromyces radiatus]KAI8082948.1 acetyl-coenzyme A transporter 1-domain-containing protein [Halteromyces radiatus]